MTVGLAAKGTEGLVELARTAAGEGAEEVKESKPNLTPKTEAEVKASKDMLKAAGSGQNAFRAKLANQFAEKKLAEKQLALKKELGTELAGLSDKAKSPETGVDGKTWANTQLQAHEGLSAKIKKHVDDKELTPEQGEDLHAQLANSRIDIENHIGSLESQQKPSMKPTVEDVDESEEVEDAGDAKTEGAKIEPKPAKVEDAEDAEDAETEGAKIEPKPAKVEDAEDAEFVHVSAHPEDDEFDIVSEPSIDGDAETDEADEAEATEGPAAAGATGHAAQLAQIKEEIEALLNDNPPENASNKDLANWFKNHVENSENLEAKLKKVKDNLTDEEASGLAEQMKPDMQKVSDVANELQNRMAAAKQNSRPQGFQPPGLSEGDQALQNADHETSEMNKQGYASWMVDQCSKFWKQMKAFCEKMDATIF